MEFQKVVESRRSVRKYDAEKKVTKEQVAEIVEAAIIVLERALGERSVRKHLEDYVK